MAVRKGWRWKDIAGSLEKTNLSDYSTSFVKALHIVGSPFFSKVQKKNTHEIDIDMLMLLHVYAAPVILVALLSTAKIPAGAGIDARMGAIGPSWPALKLKAEAQHALPLLETWNEVQHIHIW